MEIFSFPPIILLISPSHYSKIGQSYSQVLSSGSSVPNSVWLYQFWMTMLTSSFPFHACPASLKLCAAHKWQRLNKRLSWNKSLSLVVRVITVSTGMTKVRGTITYFLWMLALHFWFGNWRAIQCSLIFFLWYDSRYLLHTSHEPGIVQMVYTNALV